MSLEVIKQKILFLVEETLALPPESFKERLYHAYQSQLLDALKNCASTDQFKKILMENWSLVKGTALCYTARPEDALTLLLCDLAEYIGKETNEASIKILMPTIYTESMHNAYSDLDALAIRAVLKTHILHHSGLYLIPVRILSELKGPWESVTDKLNNYYYDYNDKNPDNAYIAGTELQRLAKHSAHTQALVASKEEYELLIKDAGLLGHLQALIRALRFNSTSGIGTEMTAGQGAYWALSQFNDYYTKLGDIANQIPQPVKAAIDRLIIISSDANENDAATKTTETCANTRQHELSHLVQEHEAALMPISMDDEAKSKLLAQAKERFESNLAALSEQLEKNSYSGGQDTLGITYHLLETFGIKPTITSPSTLQDFLTLNADEIKLIAEKNETVQTGIIQQLPDIESLALFCLTTPLEPLETILTVMGEKLIKTPSDVSACLMLMEGARLEIVANILKEQLPAIIKSGIDFGVALECLPPEQRTGVYQALKDQLPAIVKSGRDFGATLIFLTLEQCAAVCEALKAQLLTIIESSYDFGRALQFLAPEQCKVVCEMLKDQLSALINNGRDFWEVLQYLTPEQCTVVCEALKDQLLAIVKSGCDFKDALEYHAPEQRTVVYEALKDQLPAIIKNGHDFGWVLQYLTPEQCTTVCEALKDQLPVIIKNDDFRWVLQHLTPEQCTTVCEALKDQLAAIIKNDDFRWVIRSLTSEQCTAVCKALKAQLPAIVKNSSGFRQVIEYLRPEQFTAVCEAFKDQLPAIIKSSRGFGLALRFLTPAQCAVVCETLKDQLPVIIKSGRDFRLALQYLTPEQCIVVCKALKDQLSAIIKSGYNFEKNLKPEHYVVVKEALAELIKMDEVAIPEENAPVFTPNRKRLRDDVDEDVSESKCTRTNASPRMM